jgi:hypothetical protein
MTKFAAFIFLLLTSPIWVTLFVLFGAGILGLVIENWKALIFPIIIAILWNMPYKEKSDAIASNTSKAPRETYGHIFTKPKQ